MNTFKVVIIGEEGVGKTTLIKRHLFGHFENRYTPTRGVEPHPIRFNTNKGQVVLNTWDCEGKDKFAGVREGYFSESNAVIVMFDLTSELSFYNTTNWINNYLSVCENQPIILCGNKCDIARRVVSMDTIRSMLPILKPDRNITYFDISAKSNYNFEKPFLQVCKNLMGDDTRFT